MLPLCSVIISCPTMRRDRENLQAHKVVFNVRKNLINLKIPIVLYGNIKDNHISHGLHFNTHGLGKLALNYNRFMRKH